MVGVLNSKLSNFIYRGLTQESGRAFAQVKPANVRKLSIPDVGAEQQKEISNIVSSIVIKKKSNPLIDTSYEESLIDNILYSLFELTSEEISLVEKEQ